MADVVAVGVPRGAVDQLIPDAGVAVEWTSATQLDGSLDPDTSLVLATAACGVDVAKHAHRAAPDAAVILLAPERAEQRELSATLTVTPGISRHTACLVADDDATAGFVLQELDRARLRIRHRRTVSALPMEAGRHGFPPGQLTQYLGQLFEHAPVCILVVDDHGTIRTANPGCTSMLGWPPEHAVGMSIAGMFAGNQAALAADLLTDALTSGRAAVETLSRTGPDGSPQHLELTVTPVDPERDLGLFVLIRDETPRVRELEITERARRDAEESARRYVGLAWTLQESLLPPTLPEIPGVELAARFHPAGDGSEIGGDFYDVFQVGRDEWFAVMGDVCGKGAGAARLTALTRYTLRAVTVRRREVAPSLAELNTILSRQYEQDRERGEHRFVTAAAVRFFPRPRGGVAVQAGSAGHPASLVVRTDGSIEPVAARGPLLGMFPKGTWAVADLVLEEGDVLVSYTDGVTEARNGTHFFGEERLAELLSHTAGRAADEIVAAVEDAVARFQSGPRRDDTAILAIRATGAG